MHQCYTECIDRVHQFYNASCYSASMLQSACINIYKIAIECISATVHDCYSVMMLQSVKMLQCNYCNMTIVHFCCEALV